MVLKRHRLFKFRHGNELDLDALHENYLWFSDLSNLNDPYEGFHYYNNVGVDDKLRARFLKEVYKDFQLNASSIEDAVRQDWIKYQNETGQPYSTFVDPKVEREFLAFYEEHKNDSGILSFSLAKEEDDFPPPLTNMLMWSHYANGFKGFCIEYDLEKLKSSMDEKNNTELEISKVEYEQSDLPEVKLKTYMESVISRTDDSSIEIISGLAKKNESWHYENELRFISNKKGKMYYDPSCINAIYISSKMPKWMSHSILTSMMQKSKDIKLFLVYLHNMKYEFGFDLLNKEESR